MNLLSSLLKDDQRLLSEHNSKDDTHDWHEKNIKHLVVTVDFQANDKDEVDGWLEEQANLVPLVSSNPCSIHDCSLQNTHFSKHQELPGGQVD